MTDKQVLAIRPSLERICNEPQPILDPEAIERFCLVWADVGRAILMRRQIT